MNISFQQEKERRGLKWAILECLLGPLDSGFFFDAGGLGKALQSRRGSRES
jgi:hypothetical protein